LFTVFFLSACNQQEDFIQEDSADSRSNEEEQSAPDLFTPPGLEVDTTQVIIDDTIEVSF
ncbi:MAG: hypothetical protein LIP01_11160, partial [Tannerellaceae bacterium]|nr:hypothetical protein [Tannerellaceae bacterium]